ncbi:DNA helicase, partial [Tanacetum coccineum]
LLGDDKEWEIAIQEACASATSAELRSVFAHILLHCYVTDPSKLWRKCWKEMIHDILEKVSQAVQIPNYHLNEDTFQGYTLYEIDVILYNCGKSLQNFGLPPPLEGLLAQLANRLLMEERNYNQDALMQEKNDSKNLYVELQNPYLGKFLADSDLIIWDEAPVNDRHCFEALDRSLRDILTALSSLFGGIHIERKHETLKTISVDERSLVNSFGLWLLDVGDGIVGQPDEEDPKNMSWIAIPSNYCVPLDDQGLSKLIDFIYDQSTLQTPSAITL